MVGDIEYQHIIVKMWRNKCMHKTKPEKCKKCGNKHLIQDPDTLDTWFSSALWPFSTLGGQI